MNDTELLDYLYNTKKNYVGINNLYKLAKQRHPDISKIFVKDWLEKQQTHQLNTKINVAKKKVFLPIYTDTPYSFQIDLTFFNRYKKQNDDYYILFTAININTRFVYAYYSKDKKMKTVLDMLKNMEQKPLLTLFIAMKGQNLVIPNLLSIVMMRILI